MGKKLDLSKTVNELVNEYPEVATIMAGLGFSEITKKVMLNTVGRVMTIPKGAKMKGISLDKIIATFTEAGFDVVADRTEQLKEYLKRLNSGEDLESVRADFRKSFGNVDAAEIAKAEQELIQEGTPIAEVQKMCDIHSALFHGATREEQIANAEQAVTDSLSRQQAHELAKTDKAQTAASALVAIPGHPLHTLTRENEALEALIEEAQQKLSAGEDIMELLGRIRGVATHYAKKGDLLFPLLKVKYGIAAPSEVMWTVDDDIRTELSTLLKKPDLDKWSGRAAAVLERAKEMIYKEANVLFPLCAVNFSEDEWKQIYRDSKAYEPCLGVEAEVWAEGEEDDDSVARQAQLTQDRIVLPGGSFTPDELRAVLNTIPMEITFVDADNINRFFNEGPKVFKRPQSALGREMFSCHPPKIEPLVRKIIDDFRSGQRSSVPIWMEKNGRATLVNYMAVRDAQGRYLGTMEVVQDMEDAKKHFNK